jgi:hypothetical protein
VWWAVGGAAGRRADLCWAGGVRVPRDHIQVILIAMRQQMQKATMM